MSKQNKPFAKEGYDLMAAAFEVHNELGGGLSEEIYQQSLEIELNARGINFHSKKELTVYYKNTQLNRKYMPDIVVCGRIIVELKALSQLTKDHEGQLFNYMRVSKSPVGYLINFGPIGKLEYKRFVLSDFLSNDLPLIGDF